MPTEDLKQTLLQLHATLASGATLDPELVGLLRTLDADIQAALVRPAASASETPGLTTRAQELSARFAVEHPHLEPVLRELSETLQRIGI